MTEGAAGTPLPEQSATPPLPERLASRLDDEDLVTVFRHLPSADQENFIRWISAGEVEAERGRRSDILVHALGLSPLAWESRPDLPNGGRPHRRQQARRGPDK